MTDDTDMLTTLKLVFDNESEEALELGLQEALKLIK